MKIIVEKSTGIVKYGFKDSDDVQILEDRIVADVYVIFDLNSTNSEVIEGVIDPPTPMFENLYEWKDSDWKLTWVVQKKIAEISKKCSEILLEDPTGETEEAWEKYIQEIESIQDNLLISVNPLYVKWPIKP